LLQSFEGYSLNEQLDNCAAIFQVIESISLKDSRSISPIELKSTDFKNLEISRNQKMH